MFRLLIAKNGWLALVILAVAAGFGGFAVNQRSLAAAIEDHGVAAVATVEGMRTETHRRRNSGGGYSTETDHFVTYAFRGQRTDSAVLPIRIEREVPEFVWDDLSRGEEVEVRHLPENPEKVDLFPGESRREYWLLVLMAGVFGLTGLCMVPYPLRGAWRAQRLAAAGVEAQGVMEKARL